MTLGKRRYPLGFISNPTLKGMTYECFDALSHRDGRPDDHEMPAVGRGAPDLDGSSDSMHTAYLECDQRSTRDTITDDSHWLEIVNSSISAT
jgi:hypothetical protein